MNSEHYCRSIFHNFPTLLLSQVFLIPVATGIFRSRWLWSEFKSFTLHFRKRKPVAIRGTGDRRLGIEMIPYFDLALTYFILVDFVDPQSIFHREQNSRSFIAIKIDELCNQFVFLTICVDFDFDVFDFLIFSIVILFVFFGD